ncbi:MAG: hypothetical protein QOH88_3454 [Verrucomicrobiota bacterium]|jgi:hypothetical protein
MVAKDLWLQDTKPTSALVQRILEIANSCPHTGFHSWLFTTALKLHRLFLSCQDVESILYQAPSYREARAGEIEDAVRNSAVLAGRPDSEWTPKWPAANFEEIEEITLAGPTLADVQDLSPLQIDSAENYSEELIDALFPGNPLLCVGARPDRCRTKPREDWRGAMAQNALMVPSPMTTKFGLAKNGHRASRSIDGTGPRAHLVVEFDIKEFDKNGNPTSWAQLIRTAGKQGREVRDFSASLHAHLANLRPLAMLVHSGNSSPEASIHGWYPCLGEEEKNLNVWMRRAVSLGADYHTWSKAQCIRVPDGRRDNGNRQHVLYFNPSVVNKEAK